MATTRQLAFDYLVSQRFFSPPAWYYYDLGFSAKFQHSLFPSFVFISELHSSLRNHSNRLASVIMVA